MKNKHEQKICRATVKKLQFTRRIIAFNETFVPTGKAHKLKPLAVIWHEATAGRKREDIVSTFYAFFLQHRDIGHIVIWLDNCTAQNKNWCLFTFLVWLGQCKCENS